MLEFSPVTGSTAASSRAMPAPFACRWRLGASGAIWVHVAGELGPTSSPQLGRTLREAQRCAHLVVLDLRELTSIDSSGIHAIRDAGDRGRRYGGLTIVRGHGEVDRELTVNGVSDQLLVFDLHPAEPAETLLRGAGMRTITTHGRPRSNPTRSSKNPKLGQWTDALWSRPRQRGGLPSPPSKAL